MAYLSKSQHKLYVRLCDEYNSKNIQRFASFQSFLESKKTSAYKSMRPNALTDIISVIDFAKTDL